MIDLGSPEAALPCLKYSIFAFNFLIWVLGSGLLTLAIIIRTDDALFEYTKALDLDRYYIACYLCMAIGILLIIASFIGCLGAAVESPCLLIFYILLTGICIAMEITACICVWKTAGGEALQSDLTEQILDHIQLYNENEESKRFLDLIQYRLECCGARDRKDYEKYDIQDPQSCSNERTNNINIRSCGENLRRFLEKKGGALGGFSMGLVLLQLFTLGFNGCLFFGLFRREDYKGRY